VTNPNIESEGAHREIPTDPFEAIRNAPVVMWTCPVPTHDRRTNDKGQQMATVEWRGEGKERVAHCLFDGCEMTSAVTSHYRDLVLEYVAKPQIEEAFAAGYEAGAAFYGGARSYDEAEHDSGDVREAYATWSARNT
jgi:hypothetical protein